MICVKYKLEFSQRPYNKHQAEHIRYLNLILTRRHLANSATV